jgi:hypothetical protein
MITHLAAAAASCSTGTWAQKWKCGWNQPAPASVSHAGYSFGHSLLPALVVLLAIILITGSAKKRKKARAGGRAGAAARR